MPSKEEWRRWRNNWFKIWIEFRKGRTRKHFLVQFERHYGEAVSFARFKKWVDGQPPSVYREILKAIGNLFHELDPTLSSEQYVEQIKTGTLSARRDDASSVLLDKLDFQHSLRESFVHPLVLKALLHDEDTEAFRLMKDLDYNQAPSFGRIFEIRNWILPHTPLAANGLSPTEISVEPPVQEFTNFDLEIIDEKTVNLLTEEGKHNGIKVSLVGLFPQDVSDENPRAVRLKTARSDYYSNMGALATITKDRHTRHQNMSLDPENHRIPNAISIHYIIQFSDGKFLASHRSKTLAYDPERVSFSGNEQLKPEDFENESPLEKFMLRAVLEEVFPLRDFAMDAPKVAEALSLIAFGRYLSLYLEEKVGNFGLVCFIQFKITGEQFATEYYGRQLGATSRRDREGEPYLLTEEELLRFFQTGKCEFRGLTNDKRLLLVAADGLEPEDSEVLWRLDSSSLYRMWLAGQLVGVLQV